MVSSFSGIFDLWPIWEAHLTKNKGETQFRWLRISVDTAIQINNTALVQGSEAPKECVQLETDDTAVLDVLFGDPRYK